MDHSTSNREQVVDTMIDLTRLSSLHRAIVAGQDSLELYLALRRRGFIRVATTATCRIPKRQHAVGLITGRNSPPAIEAELARIAQFLSPNVDRCEKPHRTNSRSWPRGRRGDTHVGG